MLKISVPAVLLVGLMPIAHVSAEVLDASEHGFLVKSEAAVSASPEEAYFAFAEQVDRWWDPAHTFSGDSGNLSLDPMVGGWLCENFPGGGGVRHLEVVYVEPGRVIRFRGALGPLQGAGLAGSMTWTFREAGDSTSVELTYDVGGHFRGGLEKIAPVVDGVLSGQLVRLVSFVNTGSPEP